MVTKNNLPILIRIFSYSILAITFVFLVNNILTVWFDWPGIKQLFSQYGLFGFKKLNKHLEGSALTFAFTQSSLSLLLIFITMGLGMAVPYIFVSIFPQMIKFLPRPGKWMVYIRYFLGLLLLKGPRKSL